MKQKILLLAFGLSCYSLSLQAQFLFCPNFIFPNLNVCSGDQCSILISMTPTGVARVLPDDEYGDQLGINFGLNSVFNLGDSGRMDFGNSGGFESVNQPNSPLALCEPVPAGLMPNIVEMAFGGWFDLSENNRMEFEANNVLVLGGGSKIDGRLDIETEGSVGLVSSSGDVTIPNVDISAEQGINISVDGGIELGNLDNSSDDSDGSGSSSGGGASGGSSGGASSSSSGGGGNGNTGININAGGDVVIGDVASNSELRIATTSGNITLNAIDRANSISLLVDSPEGGTIKIGDAEISGTDGPVSVQCSASEDCNDFSPASDEPGSGANDPCHPDNLDPDQPNACGGGGGGSDFPFLLLLMSGVLLRRMMPRTRISGNSRPR